MEMDKKWKLVKLNKKSQLDLDVGSISDNPVSDQDPFPDVDPFLDLDPFQDLDPFPDLDLDPDLGPDLWDIDPDLATCHMTDHVQETEFLQVHLGQVMGKSMILNPKMTYWVNSLICNQQMDLSSMENVWRL